MAKRPDRFLYQITVTYIDPRAGNGRAGAIGDVVLFLNSSNVPTLLAKSGSAKTSWTVI